MNRKTSSLGITDIAWQVLGQLEITISPGLEPELSTWLISTFSELDLRPDFQDKIVRSAREGVLKAIQVRTVRRLEHLHLIIFVPARRALNNPNWGFYSIEKVETTAGKAKPDHAIEFYLYQDGE